MSDNSLVGTVYLVGAGPGDPGLITLRGMQCLQAAEVVVYDRLASDELLQLARPEAELIYCGKRPDHHELTQDQINQVLVEKALAGKTVCRLKGGDPFVFGRGGEEAIALRDNGVSFEEVPGITSAIAAPAYAGIPVTHRGIATSFAVVTGHEDPTKPETQVQWQKLATAVDTLVILMGVGNLPGIVENLLAGGRGGKTPVAIVNQGTHPEQTTLISTLERVVEDAKQANIKPPSAIVIGEVVSLRPQVAWFDNRPLSGLRGLVTRVRHQASELSALLQKHGAVPVEMPVIRLAPPKSWEPFEQALKQIGAFEWLVFTSANGVRMVQEHLQETGRDIRSLKGPKIAAIGPKTLAAAQAAGLAVALCPEEYVAEALSDALAQQDIRGKKILLLRATEAREILPERARELGAEVVVAPVYQTLPVKTLDSQAVKMLEQGKIDFITFASSSTVSYFMQALGEEKAQALLQNVVIGCIGPVTAQTAQKLGLTVTVMPQEYTIEALVDALIKHYASISPEDK